MMESPLYLQQNPKGVKYNFTSPGVTQRKVFSNDFSNTMHTYNSKFCTLRDSHLEHPAIGKIKCVNQSIILIYVQMTGSVISTGGLSKVFVHFPKRSLCRRSHSSSYIHQMVHQKISLDMPTSYCLQTAVD